MAAVERPETEAGVQAAPYQLGFAVLCVQKAVEFSKVDHKLHRATKDAELHEELEKLTDVEPSVYLYQLGGGCRVVGSEGSDGQPLSSACVGDSVAAFQGCLINVAELSEAYVPEPQAGPGKYNPAEVICHMYLKVGVELLTKLRGRFSFCMYESKSGRVLAARDGSGAVQLYQGHSPNEGLVISSTKAMMTACTGIKPFVAGDFKYGWHSEPRQFSPMEFSARGRPTHNGRKSQSDMSRKSSMDQNGLSRKTSLDHGRRSGAPDRRVSLDCKTGLDHGRRRGDHRISLDCLGSGDRPTNGSHTMLAVPETNLSEQDLQSARGSGPGRRRRGRGKHGKSNLESGRTSSSGSIGSQGSGDKSAHTHSAMTAHMKSLSVAAPEFRPTFGTCGSSSATVPPAPSPTAV